MATPDRLLGSALHGTALRRAEDHASIEAAIAELQQIAPGRADLFAEAAGITAGAWFAAPAIHVGYELIGAGLLVVSADKLDFESLTRWVRVGYDRGQAARRPPHPHSQPR